MNNDESNEYLKVMSFIATFVVVGLGVVLLLKVGPRFFLDANLESFAWFGDFYGGVLNPILAFLAFSALLYTIVLQSKGLDISRKELSETRKEVARSAVAQEEQTKLLDLQNKATKIQIFESTFFNLLSEVNGILDSFYLEDKNNEEGVEKKLKKLLESYEIDKKEGSFVEIFSLENKGNMKTYFIMLYQILKLIDDSSMDDKKKYANIVRANLGNEILSLLAINCYVYNEKFTKYINYLVKYQFFEHLDISGNGLYKMTHILISADYHNDIYGKNDELINELASYIKE